MSCSQLQLGYSALGSAAVLLPLVLATAAASPLAGSISDRVDVRWLVVTGFVLVSGGTALLASLISSADIAMFLVPLGIIGLGLGALEAPTTSATLRDVPTARAGIASGISYVTLLVGAELGLAITAAVVQNRFAANIEAATGSDTADQLASSFIGGTPLSVDVPGLGDAFSDAVTTALFTCAVVAALGAVIAARFAPRPVGNTSR